MEEDYEKIVSSLENSVNSIYPESKFSMDDINSLVGTPNTGMNKKYLFIGIGIFIVIIIIVYLILKKKWKKKRKYEDEYDGDDEDEEQSSDEEERDERRNKKSTKNIYEIKNIKFN
jgi:flagellar biosynthesis/type III secretory pathway M-ring protein FliF/YscJ